MLTIKVRINGSTEKELLFSNRIDVSGLLRELNMPTDINIVLRNGILLPDNFVFRQNEEVDVVTVFSGG